MTLTSLSPTPTAGKLGQRTILISLLAVLSLFHTPAVHARSQRQSSERQEERAYWNGIFRDPRSSFKHSASRLLQDAVQDRKPGTAIDLGMGEGRNAIFLAQRGWRVTGIDISDVAVAQARKHAAELNVLLETVCEDLDKYDFGQQRWELIALFYMHGWFHRSKLDSAGRLRDALKPGGLVVIEGFAGGQTGFQTNELLRAFSDLRILRYEDVMDEADWAPGKKSHIVRFVAEKP